MQYQQLQKKAQVVFQAKIAQRERERKALLGRRMDSLEVIDSKLTDMAKQLEEAERFR